MVSVKKGDWVQIENIMLPAGQRAPQVPADTQACDLKLWVKVQKNWRDSDYMMKNFGYREDDMS